MRIVEVLRDDAEYGFREFRLALEGVTEKQAWAVLPNLGPDYLHTDATIHGLVHHCAGNKKVYGSIFFRQTEYRWSDLYEFTKSIEPDWAKALAFLDEAHAYWMDSWAGLTDSDLELMVPTNFKTDRKAFEMIRMVSQHDSYHAGQIAMIRYGVGESDTPPPSVSEDILKYCRDSKHW